MPEVTYIIPASKFNDFKIGFLKRYPVPLDDGEPIMTENDWIKESGRQFFINSYAKGMKMLAEEAITIDNEIVE